MRTGLLALAITLSATTFGASLISPARAEYPDKTIRLILGPTPEAGPRMFAERLQKELGVAVIVEPRLGAGGDIAAKAVASSEADGYTLLYASSNYTLATAMQLGSFDFATDFEPVALLSLSAYVLVSNVDLPVSNASELIAMAKANPGKLNCASSGMATPGHLSCEMFRSMAGMEVAHVPFRSIDQAMNALIGKQVDFTVSVSGPARTQIDAGMVKGLAVTTAEPTPLVPGLPPLQATIPGFVVHGWGSVVAPKGTPKPVIDKLNAAMLRITQTQEYKEKIVMIGSQGAPSLTPEEFGAFIRNEIARWNRTIDTARVARGKPS